MRFTGLSWFRGLPPVWAAVTASAPFGIASLLITTPSTTKRLFTSPLMVDTPRRFTWMPPPGRAGVGLDEGPWDLALKRALQGAGRRPGELARAHRRDRVRKVSLLDPGGLPGHHDLFELERVGLQGDLHRPLQRRHDHGIALEADRADRQSLVAVRDVEGEGGRRWPVRAAIRVPRTEMTASPTPWPVCSLVTRPLISRTWADAPGNARQHQRMHPPHKRRSMGPPCSCGIGIQYCEGSCSGLHCRQLHFHASSRSAECPGRPPNHLAARHRKAAGVRTQVVEPVLHVRRVDQGEVRRLPPLQ